MRLPISRKHLPLTATALVLVVLYAGAAIRFADMGFFSLSILVNLFRDNAFLGVAAIGMTFVILSGGIDLSVGAVLAFTSILVAVLIRDDAVPPPAAIAISLAAGTALGLGHGCLIHYFALPPFLVTLAGMFFARGMGFIVSDMSIAIRHPFYADVMRLGIPLTRQVAFPPTAMMFLIVLAGGLYVAHFTRFGRNVYAIGGSEQSALLMGLPVGRTKVLVYALSGFCASLAGVVFTFYMGAGNPTWGIGLELDAIAAVVIGGTLLSGGVGYVAGTLMGVLILGIIQTVITFANLNTWWTKIAVGLLVLLFVLLQHIVSTVSSRSSSSPPLPKRTGDNRPVELPEKPS